MALIDALPDELVEKVFEHCASMYVEPFAGHGQRAALTSDLVDMMQLARTSRRMMRVFERRVRVALYVDLHKSNPRYRQERQLNVLLAFKNSRLVQTVINFVFARMEPQASWLATLIGAYGTQVVQHDPVLAQRVPMELASASRAGADRLQCPPMHALRYALLHVDGFYLRNGDDDNIEDYLIPLVWVRNGLSGASKPIRRLWLNCHLGSGMEPFNLPHALLRQLARVPGLTELFVSGRNLGQNENDENHDRHIEWHGADKIQICGRWLCKVSELRNVVLENFCMCCSDDWMQHTHEFKIKFDHRNMYFADRTRHWGDCP